MSDKHLYWLDDGYDLYAIDRNFIVAVSIAASRYFREDYPKRLVYWTKFSTRPETVVQWASIR